MTDQQCHFTLTSPDTGHPASCFSGGVGVELQQTQGTGDPGETGGGKCVPRLSTASLHACVPCFIGLQVTRCFSCTFFSWAQLFKRKKKLILCLICSEAKKSARGKKFTSDLIVLLIVADKTWQRER